MNKKTKMLLAGACMGLVGFGCLTGCSLTDEQTKAINLVTEKSDAIITLLEENMDYNNKKMSKEDAIEKIHLALSNWYFCAFDELEVEYGQVNYQGIFDKKGNSYLTKILYKESGATKKTAYYTNDESQLELGSIQISNFETNGHKRWNKGETTFSNLAYSTQLWDISSIIDLNATGTSIVLDTLTAEDITDIQVTESGYEFKIISSEVVETDGKTNTEITIKVSFDGYFTQILGKAIVRHGTEMYHKDIESITFGATFKYSNVDFTAVDAKIAELTAASNA